MRTWLKRLTCSHDSTESKTTPIDANTLKTATTCLNCGKPTQPTVIVEDHQELQHLYAEMISPTERP